MRTPWAVICPRHGQQFLTRSEYYRQMDAVDSRWVCPRCGTEGRWDDDNYERRGELLDMEGDGE